jgi:transcription elongation factor Elf1
MSRLSFFCVVCGHSLIVGIEHAGSLAECPNCERLVPVPGWRPQRRAGAECLGVLAPKLLGVDVRFLCPECRTKLKVDARLGGKTLPCPKCGTILPIPQWFGAPEEIGDDGDQSLPGERTVTWAPSVVLSPEELAFLGADQEVG